MLALGCGDNSTANADGQARDLAIVDRARPLPDLAATGPDLAGGMPDLAARHDLAPSDLAVAIDLAPAPDFSLLADLASSPDLAVSIDFGPPDLTTPPDFAQPRDLIVPPDVAVPIGMVQASVSGVMISENCMPQVPPDPVSVTATVRFTNTGNVNIGPITVANGIILQNVQPIANFSFLPSQTPVLAPGDKATLTIAKLPNTIMPANGCATLSCNSGVQLAVPYDGPGVPMGNRAVSGLTFVTCTF